MGVIRGVRRIGVLLVAGVSAVAGLGVVFVLLPTAAHALATPALIALLALLVLPVVVLAAWEIDRRTALRQPVQAATQEAPTTQPATDRARFDREGDRRVRHDKPRRVRHEPAPRSRVAG